MSRSPRFYGLHVHLRLIQDRPGPNPLVSDEPVFTAVNGNVAPAMDGESVCSRCLLEHLSAPCRAVRRDRITVVMPEVDDVRRHIQAAFPARAFFGPITGGCKCDECAELSKSLRQQSWDTLSDNTMDAQFGSLPLLSPEAFAAYLPAWLMRSLDSPDNEQQKFREWTLYTLALYHDVEDGVEELLRKTDWLRWRAERLTPEQIAAIGAFLQFIRDHARISDWDRESIDRAIDVVWD